MDPDSESLRAAVEETEAEIGLAARHCADLIRMPLTRKDAAALRRALVELTILRQRLTYRINQYRFWRPGSDERPVPPRGPTNLSPRPVWATSVPRARYLVDLDARARKLALVTERLAEFLKRGPRPLFLAEPKRGDPAAEQLAASDRVFAALHRVVNPGKQDPASAEFGCHPDIPLLPSVFLAHAQAALRVALAQNRPAPLRFLDVGCGGGVKVMLAAEVFHHADGLEYDPGYVAAARSVLDLLAVPRSRILQADALTFPGYADYDVIYFYQPMKAIEDLVRLERHIVASARPGTVLIAPYAQFRARAEGLGCGAIAGDVHVTGCSPAEAAALRQQAETTGTSLIRPYTPVDSRDGYLIPMIEACHRCGIALD